MTYSQTPRTVYFLKDHLGSIRATAHEIKELAIKEGMRTLRQSAMLKLQQGITTMNEVLRETES